jgi:hypothetical protein
MVDKRVAYEDMGHEEMLINRRVEQTKRKNTRMSQIYTGKILHLDGDRRYSEKASRYYRKLRSICYCKARARK